MDLPTNKYQDGSTAKEKNHKKITKLPFRYREKQKKDTSNESILKKRYILKKITDTNKGCFDCIQ